MIPPLWVFILVIVVITLIPGIILNGAIVIVHIKNWKQHLQAGGCDRIVLTMASANVLLQLLLTYGGVLFFSQLNSPLCSSTLSSFFFMFPSLTYLCFWSSSWLSVYYCLRLVNFSQTGLLWIQSRFPPAMTALLLGSTLGSFLINLPLLWTTIQIPQDNTGNMSVSDYNWGMNTSFLVVNITFGSGLPFLIILFCILLSVKSLLRHIWKMKKTSSDIKYSHLQGHIRAVRTMMLRLFLDLMFCIIFIGVMSITLTALQILTWIFMLLYPSLQSMILITGNHKLMKDLFDKRQNSSEPSNA